MNVPATRKRILIAEDIPSVLALMVRILTNLGFEVATAQDGEECLRQVARFVPDLIIVDIMMPKLHGVEVLQRVKGDSGTSKIGVIICTAKTYKPDHDQVMALGAYAILVKPFQKEQLVNVVEQFFSGQATAATAVMPAAPTAPYSTPAVTGCAVTLWGTRGSIPVSGARFLRHGGNTSCVAVADEGEVVILDAGSGIRELGLALAKQGPRRLHIFISHTHWDHIQGFPFFAPAYIPGFELHLYGAPGFKKDLPTVFRGQLDSDYFPVQFEDMRASMTFHRLDQPFLKIGPFELTWAYTHHPAATLAYKIKARGKTLAYVSDNEFLYGHLGAPHAINLESEVTTMHRPLVEFLRGTDLLIAEAQYLNEEYRSKIGWGHSSVSNACLLAKLAEVKRWIVTHHDPLHDDELLGQKLNATKEMMRSLSYPIEVVHGYDGMTEFL